MMKHKAFTFWEALAVIAVLVIGAVIFVPPNLFSPARGNARRASCASNLKQIGLGYLQYAQDYNDKFPITTTKQGWFGAVQPYLKSTAIFRCPSEERRKDDNLTDYWFNRRLAGIETKAVQNTASTLLSGDGEPSDDPNVSLQLLPPLWVSREDSPARRHLEGGNYGFADGHVKWFKPSNAPSFVP